jgi:hypothetical protein
MTPEGLLLRQLLSILGGRCPSPLPAIPKGINWPDFRCRVKNHRLGPLFFRKLPENIPLPGPVRSEWEEEYRKQLARAVLRGGRLRTVLNEFSRRGIEAIVLKGGHLAETYYSHPALRPADDLDLLIRPRDEAAGAEILAEAGGKIQERTATAEKYLFSETSVFLELHTDLQTPERRNPAFAIRIEDFWAESQPARIAGGETRVLSPTLNLLYLAAHLSHHGFSRLIWFYDLFLIIEKSGGEIDWEKLSAKAKEYRCAGQVYYPFIFTEWFFGKTAPSKILQLLAPSPGKRLITRSFINPSAMLEDKIPVSGPKALRNRLFLNDNWRLAMKNFF